MSEQIRHQLEHILNEEHIALRAAGAATAGTRRRRQPARCLEFDRPGDRHDDGQVSTGAVSTMLGTLDDDRALSLVEAMVAAGERVMALVNEAAARGIEWEALLVECRSVASYCDGTAFTCRAQQRHGRH